MSRESLFEGILPMMHRATLGDVRWSVPASMINESVGTHANNLAVCEGTSADDLEVFLVRSCFGSRRRKDVEDRYFTQFLHRDEAVPRIFSLPDGELTPTGQLYTDREKKTSPVYNGSRRIRNGLYVRLRGPGESNVVWSIADSTERGGGWSATQIRMLEHLLPHVRQFARVRAALADAGALGSSLGELLVNGRFGVVLLDGRGRVVAANDRARGLLLQRLGGLCDRRGLLTASMAADDDALQRLLARALPPPGIVGSPGSMTVGRIAARTRLVVHVTPVRDRECDSHARGVAALVLIADPECRPLIDAELVARALDLTAAESRLAAMVAAGRTLREIAATSGRREAVVRRRLDVVFRKQGISRQADLVRLVLSLDGFPGSRLSRSRTGLGDVSPLEDFTGAGPPSDLVS